MDKQLIKDIIRQLKDNILILENAAFEVDGTTEKDVSLNTIESTSTASNCIIEMRHNVKLLKKLEKLC